MGEPRLRRQWHISRRQTRLAGQARARFNERLDAAEAAVLVEGEAERRHASILLVVDVGGRLDEALHHIEFGVLARRKEGGAAVRQADNVRLRAGLEERANDPRLACLRRHRERAARNPEYVEVVELRLVGQEDIDALRASLGDTGAVGQRSTAGVAMARASARGCAGPASKMASTIAGGHGEPPELMSGASTSYPGCSQSRRTAPVSSRMIASIIDIICSREALCLVPRFFCDVSLPFSPSPRICPCLPLCPYVRCHPYLPYVYRISRYLPVISQESRGIIPCGIPPYLAADTAKRIVRIKGGFNFR